MIVTRLACTAHRLVSSNRCTMKSSVAWRWGWGGGEAWSARAARRGVRRASLPPTSCNASRASAVHRNGSGATPLVISRACGREGRGGRRRARARAARAPSLPLFPPPHQPRKREFADEQLRAALVLADLAQGDGAGAVAPFGWRGGGWRVGEGCARAAPAPVSSSRLLLPLHRPLLTARRLGGRRSVALVARRGGGLFGRAPRGAAGRALGVGGAEASEGNAAHALRHAPRAPRPRVRPHGMAARHCPARAPPARALLSPYRLRDAGHAG